MPLRATPSPGEAGGPTGSSPGMVLAEVSPSGDGGMGIVELLKAKRGGKSLPCGDDQLAVVAEAMVGDGTSAATLRENIGDASMVDVVSPYFATAMGRDTLPPFPQAILRAWWLGAAQTGGALQVARSASALPGRVASAPAAEEESALTEVQVAELASRISARQARSHLASPSSLGTYSE